MSEDIVLSNWQSDPAGRVANISLAPNAKNALYPLFEAIMNSIQAIEERFGRDNLTAGQIVITLIRDEDGNCCGFRVRDNGIGFTPGNLASFLKMDSRHKAKLGGKGVGRLLWLKVADEVKIHSTFVEESSAQAIKFTFCLDDPIRDKVEIQDASEDAVGTTIELAPYHSSYATSIPKKSETIANRVLAHFISYFVNISQPTIEIDDGGATIDLFDQFTSSTERDRDFKFKLIIAESEVEFTVHCFLLPKAISDDEKSTNALYLAANGRAVKRFEMDGVLGMKAINGKFAFLGCVESELLDGSANETRTDFSLDDEELEAIVDEAKALAKEFLEPEIEEIRERQRSRIVSLRTEHPRFLSIAREPDAFVEQLHLSKQSEEEIFVELSRQSLRGYNRRKSSFSKSVKKKLPDITDKAKEFVNGLQAESVSSLAEYVMKRKLILEVFEESLKYTDLEAQSSEYENVVHELICPLRSTTDDLDYEDHNLWIVDDRLAFFSYFNSDKPLKDQLKDPDNPLERPDISIFDLGLGFQNTDVTQPITIIEFKRPKIDNYTLEKNPITQVRSYVEQMRTSGVAQKYDGETLRYIGDDTPFYCHIIADITPSLKRMMKSFGPFHQKAGSGSFYNWDEAYKIFIEVSSFDEVLRSAKVRNAAFFDKLNLN